MAKKVITDLNVKGKKVLIRVDFNVPMKDGVITDDNRIREALPTIKYLLENNAKVILCSHLGKPKGEIKPELSLKSVANRLSEYLGFEVKFSKDIVGENQIKDNSIGINHIKDKNLLIDTNTMSTCNYFDVRLCEEKYSRGYDTTTKLGR